MGFSVIHLDVGHAAHHELELLEVEHEHEGLRDDLVEADEQLPELLLNAGADPVLQAERVLEKAAKRVPIYTERSMHNPTPSIPIVLTSPPKRA